MGNSILAVERQLQAALLKQRDLKEAKEAAVRDCERIVNVAVRDCERIVNVAVRDCERIVNVIEGYRHALEVLNEEGNKI